MKYTLTLIGKPLDEDVAATVRDCVTGAGEPEWLAPGHACDIAFTDPPPADAEAAARAALAGAPIDVVAQESATRRRRLLVADMDSTVITVECIDEMADMLGLKSRIAEITARAMRGEMDFADALRARVAMLRGLEAAALQQVYDERVRLTAGARALVMTMRGNGAYTVLVSGGFRFFTAQVATAAGFDEERGNALSIRDGRLDGSVIEPILGADAKREALLTIAGARGIDLRETIAVGDGANDLDMLRRAGLGVAFHAKPAVARAAGARIEHNDLTALLYIQGYRHEDIAE